MTWKRSSALAGACLLILPVAMLAATGGQRPVDLRGKDNFKAASELVTTAVTVRDHEGRLVTTLERRRDRGHRGILDRT
jgi:hypothetical protein